MYATFEETPVSVSAPPYSDVHQQSDSMAPMTSNVPEAPAAQDASHSASSEDTNFNPSHVIGALRMFVINNAHAPPPVWRRYRHEMPATVAELQLHPSSVEPLQSMPSSTFAIQLDKEPETSVTEYCSEVIDYVMTHFAHVGAQSPIISLRFSKVGSIVSQCIVTVGNNDVNLARQLVANLNEVGFPTGFVASKVPPPCATMVVWDVKRSLHGGRGILTEDIETLLAPQGPNGRPIVGGVTVVKAFEDRIYYATMKRPDVTHAWLMNTSSSWLFQRELYSKLGVLVVMAQCEHDWAQRRGVPPDASAQQPQQQQQPGGGDGSGDDEEEEEFLSLSNNNIDIFGMSDKKQVTIADEAPKSENVVEVAAPWETNGVSMMGQQYSHHDFPEIVGDDEEDVVVGDGLFAPPVLGNFLPPQQFHAQSAYEWNGLPAPNFGGMGAPFQNFPPNNGFGNHFPPSALLQAPSSFGGGGGGGVLPPILSYDHLGPTFTSVPLPVANYGEDASPVPDILMPEEVSVSSRHSQSGGDPMSRFVDSLERTEPHRIASALADQRNRRFIAELTATSNQTVLERVAALMQVPIPPRSHHHAAVPLRFRPSPVVLDMCLQERSAVALFPFLVKLTRALPSFVNALAVRLVGNLHRPAFRVLVIAVLESDHSAHNPLVADFLKDPIQWCVDAAEIARPTLFQFPHLMVPYGVNGFRVIFEQSSEEQKAALKKALRNFTAVDINTVVEASELMGRALIVSALFSGFLDTDWLLERVCLVPSDNKLMALLIDFACVVVHGSAETLFCEAVLVTAGKFCALVDASQSSPPAWTDDMKVDFLHQFVLRRCFTPAQDKYHILRESFRVHQAAIGAAKGPIAAVFDLPAAWPRKQVQASQHRGNQQGGLLPIPTGSATTQQIQNEADNVAVVLPTRETAFTWNDQWSEAFLAYPLKGEPFPDPTTTSEDGTDIQRWKWSVSKSYGHYYFKNEERHSKPTYKHPSTNQTYMVSPQAFVALEDSQDVREALRIQASVSQEAFDEWLANQRHRDKALDEAVLSVLKITYREQQHNGGSKSQDDHQGSRILKSQRDLERKLKFVQELDYPPRGHPFPTLSRGWTCSLSASNGLYYFKRQVNSQQKAETVYEHPDTKKEYPPTPQAYAFFEGIKEQKLLERLSPYGVTLERIQTWMKDQTVRDLDIDYYVAEKVGVKYDKATKSGKRARSESR
ncbi:Hypothetical protein, putative [Bodo saltans]|uniref:Uncharacterized protein n=1 Tax=Bodo saltans TaxID=75058 RepID=A0A0S4JA01_BODSA|nr:Hypothetical protein, putative [Bodo saltans]|eukprot:CUG86797.1 Hypothetical protein, putative [Bodo saltans]